MTEGSHHEAIRVGNRIVGHIRVTNSGKILSVWFAEPYNQLFLPESDDLRPEEEEDPDYCTCRDGEIDIYCRECY